MVTYTCRYSSGHFFFLTVTRHFISRHAFLPTTVAAIFASWFYQSLPLKFFVPNPFSDTMQVMICSAQLMALVSDLVIALLVSLSNAQMIHPLSTHQ